MSRKEEILKLFTGVESKELLIKSVDDLIFLEEQLEELRKLPHIKYHPTIPNLQKRTEAGKLYKEYLQQYNGLIRALSSVLYKNETDGVESPLRDYFNRIKDFR